MCKQDTGKSTAREECGLMALSGKTQCHVYMSMSRRCLSPAAENHAQKSEPRAFPGAETGSESISDAEPGEGGKGERGPSPRVARAPRTSRPRAPGRKPKRKLASPTGSGREAVRQGRCPGNRGPWGTPPCSAPARAQAACPWAHGSPPGEPTNLLGPLGELLDAELLVEIRPDKEGEDSRPHPVDGVGEAQDEHLGFLARRGLLLGAVAAPGAGGERGKARGAEQGAPGFPGRRRRGPRSWRRRGRCPAQVAAAEAAESSQGQPPLGSAGGPGSGGSSGQRPRQKPAG